MPTPPLWSKAPTPLLKALCTSNTGSWTLDLALTESLIPKALHKLPKRKQQQFHSVVMPRNHNNYGGGTQQFSNWTCSLLNRRKTIPGTRNIDNYPGLGKLWSLKNLQSPLYCICIIPNRSISSTDKWSSNPFSRNFSWQQMEIITDNHNWSNERCLVPTDTCTIQLPHLRPWVHFGRGGRKILRARETSLLGDYLFVMSERLYSWRLINMAA